MASENSVHKSDDCEAVDAERISITWYVEDILLKCPVLNRKEAIEVLRALKCTHDASIGINWDVIESVAQTCYPNTFQKLGK